MNALSSTAAFYAAALALTHAALAQDKFPTKPITVVVPQAAGGGNDAVARIFGQDFGKVIGHPVAIDNRPGAGGNIGTALAGRAPKDGDTIMTTLSRAHVVNPSLYEQPGFDPIKDFESIAPIAVGTYLLVSSTQFPAKSVKELIGRAKANPGSIQYAFAGSGTHNHLLGEMLNTAAELPKWQKNVKESGAQVD